MELPVKVQFNVDQKDELFWHEVLSGLCEGKQGAWLEEKVESLGSQAESELATLMDACESSHGDVIFEGLKQEDLHFQVIMVGGYGVIDCIPRVKQFLSVCGVYNIILEPQKDF